jgi:hypothetical protein
MFVGKYKALDRQTDTIQFYYTDFAMKSQTCTVGDQLYCQEAHTLTIVHDSMLQEQSRAAPESASGAHVFAPSASQGQTTLFAFHELWNSHWNFVYRLSSFHSTLLHLLNHAGQERTCTKRACV